MQPAIAAHVQPEARTAPARAAHVQPEHGTSTTCDAPETAPTTTTDHEDPKSQKKSVHVRDGDPLEDTFRAVYWEVVKERSVTLPSPEFLWQKFTEYNDGKSFTRRSSLKRCWRGFVFMEHDAERVAAKTAPAAAEAPQRTNARTDMAAELADQRRAKEELRRRPPAPETIASAAQLQLVLENFPGGAGPALVRAVPAAPEPRSLSA
ncbi:MAG: hypothetical protein KF764_08490 [Labilithrix sp.]|nr:hypothetical protein [Labilithrix sp.]